MRRGIVGTDESLDDIPANGDANAFGGDGLNGENYPVVGDVVGVTPFQL